MSQDSNDHSHIDIGKKRVWVSTLVGGLVAMIFILYMITYTVRQGELAVLKTFGKVTRKIEEPGLYWKLPLAQRAVIYDARLHTSDDGILEETMTRSGKPIMVMIYFTWRISDVEQFDRRFLGSLEKAQGNLRTIVRAAKGEVFGLRAFSDFITTETGESPDGQAKMRFEEIEKDILERVRSKAGEEYGVEITQVGVMRLTLPEAVTQKVFERMKSERQALAVEYLKQGESAATDIRSRAERDRDLILYTALARAKIIRAEGEKAAANYYNIFAEQPELHKFLKSLETLRLLAKKTTLIIDTSSPPFHLLGKDAIRDIEDKTKDTTEGQD